MQNASCADSLLTLDAALRLALQNNRLYRIALAEEKAALNQVSLGEAGLLPKAEAVAAYGENVNDTRQVRVGSGQGTTVENVNGAKSTSTAAGVAATWTVFEGMASVSAYRRLQTQGRMASLRSEEARQDLAGRVIVAYGDAVRQKRVLAALDTAVGLSRERVKITEGKYRLGSLSKLDLLQARLDLNADLSARLTQDLAVGTAKRSLNRVLARPENAAFDVLDTIPLEPLPDLEALRAAALAGNAVYLQAGEDKHLARLAFREYVGRLFPKVALNLGYNYGINEAESGFLLSNQAVGWTYGVSLRMTLFDGFAASRDMRNARLVTERAEMQYEETRAQVEADVAQAHAAYRASLEILALESDNLQLARENVGIAMERLRLGSIAALDLRAAQEKYVAAETRMVSARFASKKSETELLRLAGRLAAGR